jgi:glycosyltransferase involved in cell wall biosynthesis
MLVDPYDTSAIARAVRQVDADADLRADLAARGRIQAARFSREAYRERLDSVYRRLL